MYTTKGQTHNGNHERHNSPFFLFFIIFLTSRSRPTSTRDEREREKLFSEVLNGNDSSQHAWTTNREGLSFPPPVPHRVLVVCARPHTLTTHREPPPPRMAPVRPAPRAWETPSPRSASRPAWCASPPTRQGPLPSPFDPFQHALHHHTSVVTTHTRRHNTRTSSQHT